MPPLIVNRIEPDGEGGFFIEWHDPSNLDGKPLTAFFHLTKQSLEELRTHERRPNRAPEDRLDAVVKGLRDGAPMAQIGQLWRQAYNDILADRIDRHSFGMKAVTSHGHADLEAVRGGAAVLPENRVEADQGFQDFIATG